MSTFIAAYLVIWLAVACYVCLLGVRQHRLEREIEELRAEFMEEGAGATSASKAA